jgi:hypothetical protein
MDKKEIFMKDIERFQEEIAKLMREKQNLTDLRAGVYVKALEYFLIAQNEIENMKVDARIATMKLSQALNLIIRAINNIEKES